MMNRRTFAGWVGASAATWALSQNRADAARTASTDLTLNAYARPDDEPDATWEFVCRTPGKVELAEGQELGLAKTDPGTLADGTLVMLNPASKIGNDELAQLVRDFAGVNLTFLDLADTNVTDDGLAHLADVPGLKHLRAYRDGLTDAGLEHLTACRDLTELRIGLNTGVTDAGVERLAKFTNLTELDLGGTSITDAGMVHLAELTALRLLWLVGTAVTDAGLGNLEGLTNLNELGLSGVGWTSLPLGKRQDELNEGVITDQGLAHLSGLTRLGTLWLGGPYVTDTGMEHLESLVGLRRLWLAGTKVSDAAIAALREQLPDCRIRSREDAPGYLAMLPSYGFMAGVATF